MSRILAAALAVAICSSTWLSADEVPTKKTVHRKAATNSEQQMEQLQAQLKEQQQQIGKLQTQLQQTQQALQQAQQKLQSDVQQTSREVQNAQKQAAAAQQTANSLSDQVTQVQTAMGSSGEKPVK